MRALREILRQKLQLGRSHRAAARAAGVGAATVASAATRALILGLDWVLRRIASDVIEVEPAPAV
jgi:hypothetical protein